MRAVKVYENLQWIYDRCEVIRLAAVHITVVGIVLRKNRPENRVTNAAWR